MRRCGHKDAKIAKEAARNCGRIYFAGDFVFFASLRVDFIGVDNRGEK
jgi:hypothetical protein